MKCLGPAELFSFLPPDDGRLDLICRAFDEVLPFEFRRPGEVLRAVKEGFLEQSDVAVNGAHAMTLLHHCTIDGGLAVDVAQTVRREGNCLTLFAAADEIARQKQCRYVTFHTARRGMVRLAMRCGYRPDYVGMVKGI